jgi:phosphatidylserine/phosphatidylglycerophosphate/cardiolipin synthase-like enzyme
MSQDFQVSGRNSAAPFTLKVHRGEGMALLAMNWKAAPPPDDFVGFSIEYREPDGDRFFALKNRLCFPGTDGGINPDRLSTRLSPIQMFRWVHFPRNAELDGAFTYRVTPVFMNDKDELSYGEAQEASIELRRETYPGKLNVAFTRGFVASQAFVDRYQSKGAIDLLLPGRADDGLRFKPTHPETDAALAWMGFEARSAVLELLDEAIADPQAQVRVVAYDLNEPGVVSRLERLGGRLKVIIDDEGAHGKATSAETQAEQRLVASAGAANVKRQHMGGLQHNKTIVVKGPGVNAAVCGSTNLAWRGFFVQNNNAVVVRGPAAADLFMAAFESYWNHGDVAGFGATASSGWQDLQVDGVDAKIAFSPHVKTNALLASVADDIRANTASSLFYSLAFLYQTPGVILDAINQVTEKERVFVYGISDKKVGGIVLTKPDGNQAPVGAAALEKNVPPPFNAEPTGGGGTRMHHKFVVIDFDQPTARVYLGSYNFSASADTKNGENLVLIRDRRVAVSYMVEALRIFDHYAFRVAQQDAKTAKKTLSLARPPRKEGDEPWWRAFYKDPHRIRDREIFA